MNPPTVAPVVDNATPMFFPDGSLAYDEELGRLQQACRKASGNAEMMREMEGDYFTANLFDRQTGQIVSASDARWNPEYGNTGELEVRIGAIISHLDGALLQLAQMPTIHPHLPSCYGIIRSTFQYFSSLQIALRMRGLGVFPIYQLAFDERDMQTPEGSEQWYVALAQSPNAVINSYQVHLAAKLSDSLRVLSLMSIAWAPRNSLGLRSEPEMRNLANSIRAFQLTAVKGDFSARISLPAEKRCVGTFRLRLRALTIPTVRPHRLHRRQGQVGMKHRRMLQPSVAPTEAVNPGYLCPLLRLSFRVLGLRPRRVNFSLAPS